MKSTAVAFDFDGTLIRGGPDKGIHILYAAWVACRENGFQEAVHPDNLSLDLERMTRAYLRYPGAPRFQQLSAIVNCLLNDQPVAVSLPAQLGIRPELQKAYENLSRHYNDLYSALNNVAARKYWAPYPRVKDTLREISVRFDLYIASGVTQEILENDFTCHGFDRALFQEVWGGNTQGGSDKGEILLRIKTRGYASLLFVGDSIKDLEYARLAGANFFRIQSDDSYRELLQALRSDRLPDEQTPWNYTPEQIELYLHKTRRPLEACVAGTPMSAEQICDWINS